MGLKQRVPRLYPVDIRLIGNGGLEGPVFSGKKGLGMDEIDGGEEVVGVEHLADIGSDDLRYLRQYAYNLPALVALQLAYAVIGLHDLRRLDIYGAAGGTLVVDDTGDAAFQSGGHGNDKTAVADGGGDVLVDDSLTLCRL